MEHKILEDPDLNNSAEGFFGSINKRTQILYILILFFLVLTAGLMIIIRIPVYLESPGTFRPFSDKKQICSPVQGIIEKILAKEDQKVRKDDVILIINTEKEEVQLSFVNREIISTTEWLKDCIYLANNYPQNSDSLRTPKYRSEFIMNQHEQQVLEFEIRQILKDMDRLRPLVKDSLVSRKELEDMELRYSSLAGKLKSNINYKRNQWHDHIDNYRQRLVSLSREKYSLEYFIREAEITSPAAGTIQGIRNIYPGEFCPQGKLVCLLIPDSGILVEMFIPSKDIGFIKPGMKTRFKIDAFDYKYWGFLDGKCISISNDYEIVGNLPFFRVICQPDLPCQLNYNGKTVEILPGMNVTSQFLFTTRNVWQLVRDEIYDWIDE